MTHFAGHNSDDSAMHRILHVGMISLVWIVMQLATLDAAPPSTLPNSKPLAEEGDFSVKMVSGIDRYLSRALKESVSRRRRFWKRDFSSPVAYAKSIEPNRRRFRTLIGAVDRRSSTPTMELVASTSSPALISETESYRITAVRWPVFDGVWGEGLLLDPKRSPVARIVALPDADWTPEMLVGLRAGVERSSQFARRLAEAGCQVIVPVLIDRRCTWSGNPDVLMTDQSHREWVYRQAFEIGRHLIGFEVQKVLAAVDWFTAQNRRGEKRPIGVAGFGEGALIAGYSAAIDERIKAALVSGYFDAREQLHTEPIERNLFGLLQEFGDAEIAGLIAPRALIVEHSAGPVFDGVARVPVGRRPSAAPGRLRPPRFASVRNEVERARQWCSAGPKSIGRIELVAGRNGGTIGPGSEPAVSALLRVLGIQVQSIPDAPSKSRDARKGFDPAVRQRRQITQLMQHCQRLLRNAERTRAEFWKRANSTSIKNWRESTSEYRRDLWSERIGRLPAGGRPPNPRTRLLEDRPGWTAYEVLLDVGPDLFAWGYLLVPKRIPNGEKRPVVVCQHGLEGLPNSVIEEDRSNRAYRPYRAYAVQLVERGFIVFAPHNPYRGETAFRQLQRKANPLKLTLFSFIIEQHRQILDWLSTLPAVDARRIGFYGLSYGGTSAMRIPAVLERYALSICSACFNDWTRKIMSLRFRSSYMFTREYEQFSFGLGATFNHAEMAHLIAPRPFMVERGHRDGVAPDEWVAFEYAKVRRLYATLGISDRTRIEFFDGGHVINGKGTFEFLHQHLKQPAPAQRD